MTTVKTSNGLVAILPGSAFVNLYRYAGSWRVAYSEIIRGELVRTRHEFGSNRAEALKRFQKYRDGKGF